MKPLPIFLAAIALSAPLVANGGPVTYTFNFNSLADGASNSTVQTYLQTVAAGVTVAGSKAERDYTGDTYVTGPSNVNGTGANAGKTKASYSETLGTSDSGVHHTGLDTFLVNSGSDRITMVFPFLVYGVSFDFEIFPNSQCPNGTGVNTSCDSTSDSSWPDFTLRAGLSGSPGTMIDYMHTFGVLPGSNGTFTQSPHSVWGTEKAPQFLGQSGMQWFVGGVNKIQFVDWPVMIGIDNLVVYNYCRTCDENDIPEPGSIALFGAALFGLAAIRRRHNKMTA